MAGKIQIRMKDFSSENSSFEINTPDITAANYDSFFTPVTGAIPALTLAVQGVTIGNVANRRLVSFDEQLNDTPATDPFAQRELKWFVPITDGVTGGQFHFTIATPDLALLVPGTDFLDMANGTPGDALRDLLQNFNFFRSPDGTGFIVGQIYLVGRNL